ncbi:hypothetical protein N1031_09940 [Herbiconiux moechotypicola]|uniref:Uncharacterized protein n=1 Tax=Herbiconiux moechotypicola TaxID=637393 RepID=A0ABP5QG64_9MICO|nr:hypothetical protein [Herbiconiux moechotypicola]MCS5730081.1 hypothetical protein [Herbiconiux moechotypicola]
MQTVGILITVVIYAVGVLVVAFVLGAVVRWSVRKGIEDALYSKGKDGLWGVNPWVMSAARELVATVDRERTQARAADPEGPTKEDPPRA